MCLTADSDVSKNNNINFTTRVGIKNKISYVIKNDILSNTYSRLYVLYWWDHSNIYIRR